MPIPLDPCELTLPSCQRDFVEWRRGREMYALWALDLEVAALSARSARMRARFAEYLLVGYCRQPHLTVALCGFPTPEAVLDDDYGNDCLVGQVAALRSAQLKPFTIDIGAPDSFSSAAYFSVTDHVQGLPGMRRVLGEKGASDAFPYVPHVTFGLYRVAAPLSRVIEEMRAADCGESIRLEVGKLALMAYRAAEIGGPLNTLAEFDLQHGRLEVRNAGRMDELFGPAWRKPEFA